MMMEVAFSFVVFGLALQYLVKNQVFNVDKIHFHSQSMKMNFEPYQCG